MMWIDIGVTPQLTLRIAMFRPMLPRLLDSKNDNSLVVDRDEEQECLLRDDGNIDEASQLPDNARRNTGPLQLHIHVMPDLKGRR
jgi:hypothetical protein